MNVYFIRAKQGGGLIKIGYSKHPAYRLEKMQCHSPIELEILATIAGPPSLEKRFHSHFEHLIIRNEWFAPADELLAAIARIQSGEFDLSVLPAKGQKAWALTRRREGRA